MNNFNDYLSNVSNKEINEFVNHVDSEILVKKDIDRVTADTTWIDIVEEFIPYLDNIIRNPRRFIVQEENIVPIEKAKVFTEESIKHLAQNTNLIQDVKDDGSVVPLKILNVYREETTDLYENRFIKSLVDNLYEFVDKRLNESDQRSYAKLENKVVFKGVHKTKHENVKINLSLESTFHDEVDASKDGVSLEERIEHIRNVIDAFKGSTFIKSLKDSIPVRSPIRKTNVILKEPNFMKALDLWEYLEKNNLKPSTEIERSKEEIRDADIKRIYDLAFFVENNALKESQDNKNKKVDTKAYISKVINDYVFLSDIDEKAFKNMLTKEFKEAKKKKNATIANINKKYNFIIEDFNKRRKSAYSLLK